MWWGLHYLNPIRVRRARTKVSPDDARIASSGGTTLSLHVMRVDNKP